MAQAKSGKMTTRVVIIGGGKGGKSLIELFRADRSIVIVGVVDKDVRAPGYQLAQKMGVPVANAIHPLAQRSDVDLIVDVTGDPAVGAGLAETKNPRAELIGGAAAHFIWELIEAKKQTRGLQEQYQLALREIATRESGELIVGHNPQMLAVTRLIAKVAPTPTTVLICGESGTGKELIARSIHRQSKRSTQPLVTLNCTALPANLLESELFGYKRGAFTGAYKDQPGLFEKANGGTMFLDEIGDMSLETQAKLLRVLQTGEIRAVGDLKTKNVDVRIIAATNRDMKRAIQRGEFREDLYYRINTFTFTLPPLRERGEDLALLADYFLRRACARINKHVEMFTPEARLALAHYYWPGNLREMQNVIESAVILTSSNVIAPEHLPFPAPEANHRPPDFTSLSFMEAKANAVADFERRALAHYLKETQGNISRAAELARLPRRTFHRMLAKHNGSDSKP